MPDRSTLDLADHVQSLRELLWRSSRTVYGAMPKRDAAVLLMDVEWTEPSGLAAMADRLRALGREDLAAEWAFLAAALSSDPPPAMPSDDELIRRFRRGDIGERTVRWIKDWDPWDFRDACAARGEPPWQEASEDEVERATEIVRGLIGGRDGSDE